MHSDWLKLVIWRLVANWVLYFSVAKLGMLIANLKFVYRIGSKA